MKRGYMQANARAYQLRLSKAYEGDREKVRGRWFGSQKDHAAQS